MKMKKTITAIALLGVALTAGADEAGPMSATIKNKVTTMSNGIITLNIDTGGRANKMMHIDNGTTNLLGSSGIYFDYTADKNRALSPSKAEIVKLTEDYAEVVYTNTTGDLQFQHGYILRRDVSGVYCYVTVTGTAKSSSVNVKEARVCTRLASTFLNGYVDEVMQGRIPSNSEMSVAEKSENTIQDATYRMADGSIYTKYNWAQFIAEDSIHGLMNDKMGVWNIPVSYEWLNGGPMRQELTVHATSKSPITIQMLQGEHLGGALQVYQDGEKQIFGPFFIYVNSGNSTDEMIADAKAQVAVQRAQWPFAWFENALYPVERGSVSGHISVTTGQTNANLQVVLAEPGTELIRQGKKYIFWSKTDENGNFTIEKVRPGEYTLYAYATSGDNTDLMVCDGVTVAADDVTDLGTLTWSPDARETQYFLIGQNNRRSDGFNLSDHPRAYGLWETVPSSLEFHYGVSREDTDWYYGQVKNGTWTITFPVETLPVEDALLTASIAGTTNKPSVSVRLNDTPLGSWSFPNNDAAIYRSANQAGRHVVKTLKAPASAFTTGLNRLSLTMTGISKNGGVLWDCIKLESGTQRIGAGIENILANPADSAPFDPSQSVDIYTTAGHHLGHFATIAAARAALLTTPGIYILRQGTRALKIAIR